MDSSNKKRLLQVIRWTVTLSAIAWVLSRIDWRDQVKTTQGEVIRGRVRATDEGYTIELPDGQTREVRFDETDGEQSFQPGFLTLFRQIRPGYLFLGLLVYPLSNLLGAIRWRALMRAHGMDPGFMRSVQLTWLGFFWSLVLPGVTGGDVVKAYAVARTAPRRAVAVLIVLLDRIIGLLGLALLSGLVILFNLRNSELRTVSSGILLFIAVMAGGGLLFFSRRLRRWSGLEKLLGLLPFQTHVTQLDDALFHYRYHKGTMFGAILLSLGTHVVNVGTFCFAGNALSLPVAWQHYFVFIPVMLMIAALPISVGGLGVFESGVAHFLTLRGVGATASGALALCVLYRLMTIIVSLPGAMVRVDTRRHEDSVSREA
jgi:glycosyltransferase 2 family protein